MNTKDFFQQTFQDDHNRWTSQSDGCNCFFQGSEWVIQEGHFEHLYATVATDSSSLLVPAATVYDIQSRRHWTTTTHTGEMTSTQHHYRLRGRKVTTQSLMIDSDFLQARALKVSTKDPRQQRFFVSRKTGPLSAADAFVQIINPKSKRAHQVQVLVDTEMLRQILQKVESINKRGGYSTCSVATTNSGWWVITNWLVLGPPSSATFTSQTDREEFKCKAYEYKKVLPVDPGMVSLQSLVHVETYEHSKVIPIPGQKVMATSAVQLTVCCRRSGYKVLFSSQEGGPDIQRIDEPKKVHVMRPLHEKQYRIGSRTSHTNCPELLASSKSDEFYDPAEDPFSSPLKDEQCIAEESPLALLGAKVERCKSQSYVRIKPDLRNSMTTNLQSSHLLLYFLPAQTLGKNCNDESRKYWTHEAGRKGHYKIYTMSLVVVVDGRWYFLDSLLPVTPEVSQSAERSFPRYVRYLYLG